MSVRVENGAADTPAQELVSPPAAVSPLPAGSFRAAAPFLRRPYETQAVRWKVQHQWPKGKAPEGGLIVCYIDRGLVIDRLNVVVPHLWEARFEDLGHGGVMRCALTVDGITRVDVGEAASLKARYSDSLKRAAVHFGIGVSLSRVPQARLSVKAGQLRAYQAGAKHGLDLTQAGLDYLRQRYDHWLDVAGREVFGDPLPHGDVHDQEQAQGDEEPDEAVADKAETTGLLQRLTSGEFTVRQQAGFLRAVDVRLDDQHIDGDTIAAACAVLTDEQAAKLAGLLDQAHPKPEKGDA